MYIAFELSAKSWKLAFGDGEQVRHRTIGAGDFAALDRELRGARTRFKLAADCRVISCYEAGRDGFWIHRELEARGIENQVVDSASIEVKRRKRHVKTDRVDAGKLLNLLVRWARGERGALNPVRVPTAAQEDARRPNRERDRLVKERGSHSARMRALLATVGIAEVKRDRHFLRTLERMRCADGQPLPSHLRRELEREFQRWSLLDQQTKEVEREQAQQLLVEDSPAAAQVKLMQTLRGVGPVAAHTLVFELFAWRDFKNRRELGSFLGLTPTPYNSGESEREQGISKAGPRRLRALLVELGWFWLRYQPESALSRWYLKRCEGASSRVRRTAIVALARKLLVALWKFVARGVVPEGAVFKTELKGALPQAA